VSFLADGVMAREHAPATALEARRAAASRAGEMLGVTSLSFGDFPDNRMDTVALLDVVKRIETLIEQHRPDTVLTHHAGDVNVDHRRIHEAVTAACRPQKDHPVRTLLSFEVASSTEWQLPGTALAFVPNWFVDISATLELKLAALEAYAAELREWPHPRSRRGVAALAQWRGATVGVDAAEAFVLGRQLL
jgi:LmbE family N-acetylglucosaminyl deacetylase